MLHSFFNQFLLNRVQGAGAVIAVCQDWILRCVALLNLARHLCCGDKVVREKEKPTLVEVNQAIKAWSF